jgi:hypothetical protein
MATKFYLHAAVSGVPGTLPSAEQSSLTAFDNYEADQSSNRNMDKTIGASQTSLANASNASTSLRDYYVARWVSPILAQTSISANTWTYNFAAQESNTSANHPVSGTNQPVYVCCYVWKPSNGTKYGNILDGNSASVYDEPGAANSERVMHGTFSGSAVSSLTSGDAVIVFEMWFRITQAMATSYTHTVFFDGTTENTTENAVVSNHASFIETPENLTFFYQRSVEETLGLTDAQSKLVKKSISETLSLSDAQQKLIKKAVAETLAFTDTTQKLIRTTINESLAIVDNSLKKGSKFVTDALDITDDADGLFIPGEGGELFQRSASDSLDLTDSVTKVVRKAVSESLDLNDAQNKLVKKGVTESLALNDEQQKKGNKFIQEALDIIDNAVGQFISGGGTLFQRAVNETLDLADSVSSLFINNQPPSPSIPGTGIGYRPPKQVAPIKRPALIYRINVFENLDLKDKVNSVAKHYNLPIYLITQIGIREQLTLIDEATIRVIRKGRNQILNSIKNVLETLDIIDTTEDDPVATAQELSRISINRTKTNRLAKEIESSLSKELLKILNKVFKEFKQNEYVSIDEIKNKYEGETLALIRSAVQESYILAIRYVGKALKEPNMYLSGKDVEIIKSESERLAFRFWRHAGDFLRTYKLNEHMKSSPVGLGGFLSLDGIVKFISGIVTMGTIGKATTAKVSQLPAPVTADPVTQTATVSKRVLVFTTKHFNNMTA